MEDTWTNPFFISIRPMQMDDLPFCGHLVADAGWNQLDSDWLRAMKLEPDGCFVAMIDNLPVGTTTACCFGDTAWIAMVLVDKKNRNQGIGKRLVEHTIAFLEQKSVSTIRLDATALGQGLYQKLGFQPEYEVIRFTGKSLCRTDGQNDLHKVFPNDKLAQDIFNLDLHITGTNRTDFISDLIATAESPFYCTLDVYGKVDGYAGCREGNNAIQIGPVGAMNAASGERLLNAMAACFNKKPLFIDIPAANVHAMEWASKNGLTAQRSFTRMYYGAPIVDLQQHIWASSGPEKG